MIAFFLRELVLALTVAAALLLLGEIVSPGLVLPFLNLHLFVVAVLALNLVPIPREQATRPILRLIPIIPVGVILIAYLYLLLSGMGPSATLLGIAMAAFVIIAAVAISKPYAEH